ncbi:MAG: hypothetical protein JJU36_05965 [Phycisphaeraceae bacterium]|nr:hypothetical protein [Phycisphaeraceae bacterium]
MRSVAAIVATWVLPGAGHWLLGHRVRGSVLLASIMGLWLLGLLVGGISVIDHLKPLDEEWRMGRDRPTRARSFWYYGQSLVAPSLVVHRFHMARQAPEQPLAPEEAIDEPRMVMPSFAHGYELGQLFTAIAGILNLLAMIDLLWRVPAGKGQAAPGSTTGGVRRRPLSSTSLPSADTVPEAAGTRDQRSQTTQAEAGQEHVSPKDDEVGPTSAPKPQEPPPTGEAQANEQRRREGEA